MPTNPTFENFITQIFTAPGAAPTATTVSYEFDYYMTCAVPDSNHWRDQFYGGVTTSEGNIGDCL